MLCVDGRATVAIMPAGASGLDGCAVLDGVSLARWGDGSKIFECAHGLFNVDTSSGLSVSALAGWGSA